MDRLGFLVEDLNLTRQKGTQPTTFTGIYRGYYLVFEVNEAGGDSANQFAMKIGATFEKNERWFIDLRNEIGSAYNSFLEKHRHVIMALGKLPQKNREVKDFVVNLLNEVIAALIEHDVPTGDFVNGHKNGAIEVYLVNNHYNYLSEESFKEIMEHVTDKEVQKSIEETSIQAGISGAVLGAFLGALIWAALFYFGLPSWIGALIASHLAFMLYRKRNGKLNALGVGLVSLSVIIALFAANIVIDLLIMQTESSIFSMNLLVGIGVVIVYTLIFAYGVYTSSKDNQAIKKV